MKDDLGQPKLTLDSLLDDCEKNINLRKFLNRDLNYPDKGFQILALMHKRRFRIQLSVDTYCEREFQSRNEYKFISWIQIPYLHLIVAPHTVEYVTTTTWPTWKLDAPFEVVQDADRIPEGLDPCYLTNSKLSVFGLEEFFEGAAKLKQIEAIQNEMK